MPKNEIAHELFSKKIEGNLNEKSLTKIKKKKELLEIIAINLPTLVDFYFEEVQKKKDMDVYKDQVFKTVTSHKYFYKPVLKLIKTSKKKKGIKIPKGLHIILLDSLERMRYKYEKKMKEFDNNGQARSSDMTAELVNEIKAKNKQQIQRTMDMADMLVEKPAKYFEEEGIATDYAYAIARCMVPAKYLHERNIGVYFRRLNATLIESQRVGMVLERNDGEEEDYINNVGVNLMSEEVLSKIYDAFFNGVDRDVFLKALTYFLLERKPYKFDQYNKITKGLYQAINEFILDVLEGEKVINLTGKKLDKKDREKMEISKKELRKIMEDYAKTRFSDVKAGNDSTRRITITELDPDNYPRISKIFNDTKTDVIEEIQNSEEERKEALRKNNNRNTNNKNNRNNKR